MLFPLSVFWPQYYSYYGSAMISEHNNYAYISSIYFITFFVRWRSSDRKNAKSVLTFIHLNLSASLLFALSVFVGGIETAIESKVSMFSILVVIPPIFTCIKFVQIGCAFIAALLHYLFLCAFCWMLCEGIMLYLLLHVIFISISKQWWFFMFMIIGYCK